MGTKQLPILQLLNVKFTFKHDIHDAFEVDIKEILKEDLQIIDWLY